MKEVDALRELDQMFAEGREGALRREQTAFDEAAAPFERSIVLFGAGNLGRKALAGLRKAGVEPLAFADNNERIWETDIDGLKVLSPTDAATRHGKSAVFVLSIWRGEGIDRMRERIEPLSRLGCERIVPFSLLFWKYPRSFLPHYAIDLPHKVHDQVEQIRATARLWADDASRREFVAQVRWRLFTNYDDLLDPVQHEIYFPDDLLTLRRDEVFVDCGAFDGDTIRRYLARQRAFGRIKAFEADPANFKKLESYIAKLPEHQRIRIDAYPYAVSSRTQVLSFAATGNEAASVRSGAGSVPVQGRPLDQVLADCCPTYLKMDIEGSESEGLRGAKRIVQTQQPALAVCVYHRQRHLWELPSLVRSFTDDYVYYLRPHVLECWDTVCYAIPRGRVQGPLS